MSQTNEVNEFDFSLPVSVVSKIDLHRLVNELEQLDSDLTSIEVRQRAGVIDDQKLVLSEQLRDFVTLNNLDLRDGQERVRLLQRIRRFKDEAPVVHMTFAATADQDSLRRLADWVRSEIHPQAVIAIGLQPGLLGGVYLRTANQVHDLSLKSQLVGKRDLLIKQLETLSERQ